ncbi:hypothetical protein V5053_22725, partial [Enterobacter hormaechei]
KRAYCLKTQPATGETYPKSDLFNKATQGMSRAREHSPGRINGQDVIVAQAIIWREVQQNQAS